MKDLKQNQENHRDEAQKSHSYYTEVIAKCAAEWKEISSLESKRRLTRADKTQLLKLKEEVNLVICADYQMSALLGIFPSAWQYLSTKVKPRHIWHC